MDSKFWLERWQANEIAFHEPEGNAGLPKLWPRLGIDPKAKVFVPLCGKSVDLLWLAAQGHRVVGVELSQVAVDAFFAENRLTPKISENDGFHIHAANNIEIWCGDLFALPDTVLADAAAVYDRASLIAFPPEMRPRYAEKLITATAPGTATLLLSVEYDQSRMDGPPFSVPTDEIEALFSNACDIELIGKQDVLTPDHRFRTRGRGLTWLIAASYIMRRN
jgi:thiopurine S-methyltransferase